MDNYPPAVNVSDLGRERLLDLLKDAQDKHGHISDVHFKELSFLLNISVGDIYGVASFYSFLSVFPQGRHVIRICKSIPCYIKKNNTIVKAVEKVLGIRPGRTTPDGRFSLELVNCIGACDEAPAMLVNSDLHTNLTPEKIVRILEPYN